MRRLYWFLLCMYPREFRSEYGDELLWIFEEEISRGRHRHALFTDALISLTRQWVVRRGAWKWAAAVMVALLQVVPLLFAFRIHPVP